MITKRWRLLVVVLLLVALVGIGWLGYRELATPQVVSLQCESGDGGRPQFVVSAHRVNGIQSFMFWSDTKAEPRWAFRIGPTRVSPEDLPRFRYGELPLVPDPQLRRTTQVFPRKGAPRAIAPGEKFYVWVLYQYDQAFPPVPCGGWGYFLFEMRPDGSATPLDPAGPIEMPKSVEEVSAMMW